MTVTLNKFSFVSNENFTSKHFDSNLSFSLSFSAPLFTKHRCHRAYGNILFPARQGTARHGSLLATTFCYFTTTPEGPRARGVNERASVGAAGWSARRKRTRVCKHFKLVFRCAAVDCSTGRSLSRASEASFNCKKADALLFLLSSVPTACHLLLRLLQRLFRTPGSSMSVVIAPFSLA